LITHFDARGRFVRLAQAITEQPVAIDNGLGKNTGVGIEKGTVLKAVISSTVPVRFFCFSLT
jgi:cyanophycinase